ncbi:CPBP family intramembrane glutamic endopeptidase [Pluralibacter gergoviae]|uniref:CPBP family intramembrane glutamic endopeptidase n=1 Tax=Pluralibacter gergoviae TaxID=61647 RepID=UPI0006AC1C28|nr:CPBP family intramembrane glutamic endopeptidase [Pluralibacter gergoviae]KOQ99684.1 CAAX protease [Pluralibacter gergoviae]
MWFILALSLVLLPFNRRIAGFPAVLAIVLAAAQGVLDWRALVSIGLIILLAVAWHKSKAKPVLRAGFELLLFIAALALMVHQLPGFHNLKVLDGVRAGPLSAPFTMYYNIDKALVPFVAFMVISTLFTDGKKHPVAAWRWGVLALCIPALLMLAALVGGLQREFHFPAWLPQFLFANVLFVAFAEEALFRGWIQQRLTRWLSAAPAMLIASLLFGLAHFSGGPLLMFFATLAGMVYGLAWMWSRRLWVAVLFHAGFNLCHLLFFTYPLLRPLHA